MPVLGVVRRSDWLRPFYERLRAAGKPAEPALIAALRKLLCAIYSVATKPEALHSRDDRACGPKILARRHGISRSGYTTPWDTIRHCPLTARIPRDAT